MWLALVLLAAAAPQQAQDAYERELAALQQQESQQVQTRHTTCAVGWHWNAYSKACQVCPAGKFQALPGALECEACPQGRYNLLQGQMECKPNPCPAGTEPTHTGCAECEPGSAAAKGDAACHKCDIMKGEYSYTGGMARCTASACLAGSAQTAQGCRECGMNEFQRLPGQPYCEACPPGFSSLPGAAACFNVSADALLHANAVREHVPARAQRCTHLSCQYNGHHVQVRHHGREQHGMRHHCFFHAFAHHARGAPAGDCHCVCTAHELGDELYMLIPHGPHQSVHRDHSEFVRPALWQLHDEQIDALQALGFALPKCDGSSTERCSHYNGQLNTRVDLDQRYAGFHDEIHLRQQQHAAGGGRLHWARKAV